MAVIRFNGVDVHIQDALVGAGTVGKVETINITDNTTEHEIPAPEYAYTSFIVKAQVNTEALDFQFADDDTWVRINAGLPIKFPIIGSESPGSIRGVSGNTFTAEIIFVCIGE